MWQLEEDGAEPEWRTVETPFDITLFGVAQTAEGPYAVGSRGHLVADRGDGWEIVFDDGPATRDNQMRAMDVTDDGKRVWMLGSSGAIACYDVEERKKFDYSYPEEMTSTWEGITVSGEHGTEKALASNGSGEVLPFTIDGFDVDWGQLDKPAGQGSKMAALASTPEGVGFAIDTSGNAFKTTADDGWTDIGVVNAQVKFYDVYAGKNQQVYIAAGDGRIYRYDDSYHDWTPIGVTDGTSLQSIDIYEAADGRKQMVVLGADGSIFQRVGAERWEELPSPATSALNALELGDPDVAVGENGTVIERPRGEPRNADSSADGDEFDGRGENYDGDDTAPSDDPENGGSSEADEGDSESGGSEQDGNNAESSSTTAVVVETDSDGEADATDEAATETDDDGEADTDADDTDDDDDADDADDADADGDDADADRSDDARDGVAAVDAGISRWSEPSNADGSTGTSAESDADGDGTDPQTKADVLVALAERTELDTGDVTEAAEHGSEIVEAVLTEIAEDVGIDPERVRDALNRSAGA